MKNLLFSLFSVLAITVQAQEPVWVDILNVRALQTGTNGHNVTNIQAGLTNTVGMIYNQTNIAYTNLAGSYVFYTTNAVATNAATTVSFFKDIPLYPDRNGNPVLFTTYDTATLASNFTFWGNQTLFIEYVNPRGSNAPFGFTLRPIYDSRANYAGTTPVTAADDWGVRIAGLATTKGSLVTNIPTWKWPGAKALRVIAVTNQLVLAGADGVTNSTFITRFGVGGFRP